MTRDVENIPELALAWHRAGRDAVIATVISTWGSAPRGVGAQMVVARDGAFEGSVSGGCVEGAVVFEAIEAAAEGQSRVLTFGVSDDDAFAVGLACGGEIKVLLDPVGSVLPVQYLEEIIEARAARRTVIYEADLTSDARRLLPLTDGALAMDATSGIDASGARFIHVHAPALRMIVVGAVHIAQALVPMAVMAGYDVTVIDPRPAFATTARFADMTVVDDWPDAALATIGLDDRTAVVTLTHDPKLDDPAILEALGSDVFYLGSLGSKRTHAKRVARLGEAGADAAHIARIHAPVGLDIGARGPAEIAISILAEVTARLRQGAP